MKLLKENYGESEELDNFVYLLQKRFSVYYEVVLKLNKKVSHRYFAYEDAAKQYYYDLVAEAQADKFYYDGADISLNKIELKPEEDELNSITIYDEEDDELNNLNDEI